jgi:hypothetical protein
LKAGGGTMPSTVQDFCRDAISIPTAPTKTSTNEMV